MRAPLQVLVILYKKEKDEILYGIGLRSTRNIWQFVAGGAEDKETPIEAAVRELREETSINIKEEDLIVLDSKTTIPVVNVTGTYTWGKDVFVIPEYAFAVDATNFQIKLSNEHTEFKWLEYNKAMDILTYDSNKSALWELNEKLKNI